MRHRLPFAIATTTVCVFATTAEASAKPPPSSPSPLQCLGAFIDTEADYVGEGWVEALVEGPPAAGPLSIFDSTDREFSLYCGDEMSGVAHIADPDTAGTGTGHLITAETEEQFLMCWRRTIASGEWAPQGDGRSRFTLEYREGEYATAIVDDERRLTYTLFTSSSHGSDDWGGCVIHRA